MEKVKRLRVSEVNPHLICVLCGGYYIDATTIIECLHTFCKTCIVGYLEASKHCPVCDNLVHKTRPDLRLRPDHTLQDLVYKLVPGLFQDEMKKRRDFYKEDVENGRVGENGIPEERERIIYSADEKISVILELSSDGAPPETNSSKPSPSKQQSGKSKHIVLEVADRRYLSCPGSFTIGHLKKFIRMKFNLCDQYRMDFYHTDETLHDHYSLLDVAYIYSWRRKGPLRLYYTVYTNPPKHFKADVEQITPMETDEINNSHLKTETSGYFTDEENLVVEPNKPDDFHDSKNDSGLGMDEIDYGKDNDVKTTSKNDAKNDLMSKNVDDDIEEVRSGDKETKKMESKNSVCTINTEMKKHKDKNECIGNKDAKSFDLKSNVNALEQNSEESINLMCVSQKEHCDEHSVGSSKEMSEQIDGELVKLETQATKEFRNDSINDNNITSHDNITSDNITSECSTILSQNKDKCVSKCQKVSKSCVTDEDIGEPVVSSTQNTQGCQTEIPDSSMETLERPHSSNTKKSCAMSPMYKSTVDVSCETDDFLLSRQPSRDSVSVSTETEIDSNSHKKTYVHCSTDTYAHEQDNKKSIACSAGLDVFSTEGHKRSELSIDCSMVDMSSCTNKRKSIESDSVDRKFIKMTDSKVPKRSLSYCANSSPKAAYLAQPLSPTKLTLKFTATKSASKTSSKSSPANAQSLNQPSLTSQVPKSAASPDIPGFQLPCQSVLNSHTLKSPSPTFPTQKSPSSTEPSGFQSQYQSFVMEFPEKINRFEDMPKEIVKPITIPKSVLPDKMMVTKVLSRKTVKPGRPRGRPPKYRPIDATLCSLKEKKSKSRSHSPKYVKGIEKTSASGKEIMIDIDRVRHKSDTAAINNSPKISTAYSWIKKIDSNSKMCERKPEKLKDTHKNPPSDKIIPKQFVYFSNGQYTIASVSSLTTLKQSSPVSPPPKTVFTSEVYSSEKNTKNTNTDDQYVTKTCSGKVKHMNPDGLALREQVVNEITKNLNNSSVENMQDEKSESNVSPKVDSNQNRIVKQTASKNNTSSTNDAAASNKQTVEPSQYPRYCHQIPFFAQLSGTGLRASQRPATHLNIPNLNSHFSGTHHLYSKERFGSESLGTPMCRPFSLSDSSPSSSVASKFEDTSRIEATTLPCTTYLQTYPMPYLGLMHSHLLSSLPPPPPLTRIGLYSNCTKSMSDAHNVVSSARPSSYKYNTALPKGKEKSLDRVISAITEMRTKKETQEQLNGMDLSTKGSRQHEANRDSPNNLKSGVKFEFTDDEGNISPPTETTCKTS